MPKDKYDAIIVGGGISGLTTAYFLKKGGLNPLIIEKKSTPGGSIMSERDGDYLIDYGPNSGLETTHLLKEIFADLNLTEKVNYASSAGQNRYILKNGKLTALPLKPGKFLKTELFSTRAKLRVLKEPFIKAPSDLKDESLADFVKRRLGWEFLAYAIDPFVAGIYAGTPENLSVGAAFPKLLALEKEYGSIIKGTVLGARKRKKRKDQSKPSAKMFSFLEGMQTLTDALADYNKENLVTDAGIVSISKESKKHIVEFLVDGEKQKVESDAIILTAPSHKYKSLPLDSRLKKIVGDIYYPPVTMAFFGYEKNPAKRPLDGFGYLIPKSEKRNTLGTIWSSVIFKNRAPKDGAAFTTYIGGSRQPENALKDEDEIIKMTMEDFADTLGIESKPDKIVVKKWEKAIPQYQVGHKDIIESIEKYEDDNPGIFVSGNFRGGISVADCVKQARTTADSAIKYVGK